MRGSRSLSIRAAAVAASTLLALVLASAVSLWQLSRLDLGMVVTGNQISVGDPELGYVSPPSAASTRQQGSVRYDVFTDTRGARVSEAGLEAPTQVDILTVGGSFAWGHGVQSQETFTSLLGERLAVTTANFAKAGYGTLQSVQTLRRHSDLEPAVVVYGLIGDHLGRNLAPCAPSRFPFCMRVPYVDFVEDAPVVHHPGHREAFGLEAKRQRFYDVSRGELRLSSLLVGLEYWYEKWRKARLQTLAAARYGPEHSAAALRFLLAEMYAEANEIDAALLVVYIPRLRSPVGQPPLQLLEALESIPEAAFFDLTQAVSKHLGAGSELSLVLDESDEHPSRAAHELFARELEGVVERLMISRRRLAWPRP